MIVDLKKMSPKYGQRTDVLVHGVCSGFLPVTVIRSKKYVKGIHQTAGYVRLRDLDDLDAATVLTLLRRILEAMERCRDYLFFPEEYVLSPDTIHVREDLGQVKFAYIPADRSCSEQRILEYLIHSLKAVTTENGQIYLEKLAELLEHRHCRSERIIGLVEELKEEIRLCHIR